jgi:hypothetical protein
MSEFDEVSIDPQNSETCRVIPAWIPKEEEPLHHERNTSRPGMKEAAEPAVAERQDTMDYYETVTRVIKDGA